MDGYQIEAAFSNEADANECADALRGQDGCIRAGVKWTPESFVYSPCRSETPWRAYGVFSGALEFLPDGCRRVSLVGADAHRADDAQAATHA